MHKTLDEDISDIITNFEILEGSYFDSSHQSGPLTVFRSTTFPDIGWNYSVLRDKGRLLTKEEKEEVANNIDTTPAIQVITDSQKAALKEQANIDQPDIDEYSVWMSIAGAPENAVVTHDTKVFEPKSLDIIDEAVECFRAAYCGSGPDKIGYSELGPEYPLGFKRMISKADRAYLITTFEEQEIAGVASVVLHPSAPIAGLYNVAVHPKFQRRGHGKALSLMASQFAFSKGAKRCILQTEANSEVEAMYKNIGYGIDILTHFYEV